MRCTGEGCTEPVVSVGPPHQCCLAICLEELSLHIHSRLCGPHRCLLLEGHLEAATECSISLLATLFVISDKLDKLLGLVTNESLLIVALAS